MIISLTDYKFQYFDSLLQGRMERTCHVWPLGFVRHVIQRYNTHMRNTVVICFLLYLLQITAGTEFERLLHAKNV